MSTAALTRGQNPRSALAFVNSRGGPSDLARVLARLSEEDRKVLGVDGSAGAKPVSPDAWIAFAVQGRLLRAIDEVLGRSDFTLLPEVGRFMAQRDIPTLFRPVLRAGKTGWIVTVATRVWRMYHSHGRWQVHRKRESVLATLLDHPESDAAFCATFVGWLEGALEVSGAIEVRSEHPTCVARGAPHCVFTASWTTRAHREPTQIVRARTASNSGVDGSARTKP